MKQRICIVSGARSEYGLLYPLLKILQEDDSIILQIIATGMHLSPEFGLTYKEIENDGFKINKKIETLLSSDTPVAISKSVGLAQMGIAEALSELNPDLVVLLGDRFETFAAATAAHILSIPIAHISGGEITEGAIDDAFRHAITKMSNLHFTATEVYRSRVIQLGEMPETVFNVGAIGIDNIINMGLLSKQELENKLQLTFKNKNLLITFHPVTIGESTSKEQCQELLDALENIEDTLLIFTQPNADTDGRIIIQMINDFVAKFPQKAIFYKSLGSLKYLSLVQWVDAVVGNSSSGIVEVPTFKKPTINIGKRQDGRVMPDSVINCICKKNEIDSAIQKAYSKEFKKKIIDIKNPYGNGEVAAKIYEILKLKSISKNKKFYDIL